MQGVQEHVRGAMETVELDEATRHRECPDDVKGAMMFKMRSGFTAAKSNASRVFRMDEAYDRYDLKDATQGMDHTVEGGVHAPNAGVALQDDYPELERPQKIRKVDQYCQPECPCCGLSKRYTQAWLVAIGFMISFGIRCNVGVSVVKMMENTTDANNVTELSSFNWTPETIGFVDASFFWGYIVTQIPGGFLAARFSPTKLFGAAIFSTSCLNLFWPMASEVSPYAVICLRVLQGKFSFRLD